LTVLVGTGGPRQTVIGGSKVEGPLRVVPSPQKIPGVSHQTVYTPGGGVTVLVGTGGPTQTVHHGSHSYSSHHSSSHHSRTYDGDGSYNEIDNLSANDRKKYDDRGDIPGYVINPGQLGIVTQKYKALFCNFTTLY